MPHLTLEYTSNIDQTIHFHQLFAELHQALSDVAGIDVNNCKSRAVRRDSYYIADGEEGHAFAHLQIRMFTGRSNAIKQELGRRSLAVLQEHLPPSSERRKLQISVEIVEMQRNVYFKADAS